MNLQELREEIKNGKKFNYVFFWGAKGPKDKACFSQWYRSYFEENGVRYNCCEQYMMAKKAELFGDEEILKEIMESSDPKTIKSLGRKVKNFDAKIWNVWCDEIVEKGNYLKFTQNPDLKSILLSTKDSILVEASPYDAIWGIKLSKDDKDATNPAKWQGQNKLGFALTKVREQIRNI